LLPKHHIGIHHSRIGEGAFATFKKWGSVDVLAHLYIPFFESMPYAMMQIGHVCNEMQLVAVMWEFPRNMAPFNKCLTSREGPQFWHIFPSKKGFLTLIQKNVEPLLCISLHSLLLLVLLS
jgi:hypothetical protein